MNQFHRFDTSVDKASGGWREQVENVVVRGMGGFYC